MPYHKRHGKFGNYEVCYDFYGRIHELPSIDNDGNYVPKQINRENLIHATNYSDCRIKEKRDDMSMASTQHEPLAKDPTVQAISDLVSKDTLFYSGFCFGGVAKHFSTFYDLEVDGVGMVQFPPVDAQMEKLLNLTEPRVIFDPIFSFALELMKVKLAIQIGCPDNLFNLVFKKMIVNNTEAEAEVCYNENEFGTLFVVPPTEQTGVKMKVYRKMNEGDQEEEWICAKLDQDAETESSKWHYCILSTDSEDKITRVTFESRLVFVFTAAWNTKQQPKLPGPKDMDCNFSYTRKEQQPTFPGPEHIDRIAAHLERQSAKGDFLVAFLDETYNNFKNVGELALNKKDRSLLRQLKVANNRIKKPFKVVLVSIVRDFLYQEYNNEKELAELYRKYFFETVNAEWKFKECNILQQWFDLGGNSWPQQPKANLELMTNVLNPKKSLKQLWGSDATQKLQGIPDYDDENVLYTYDATKTVTYKRSLLVLWPPELAFERVAEFEGWDVAFKTLIGKTSDSAAFTSLLQLFNEKKGYTDTKELVKNETIRLIYDYIAENIMLDLLPVYIDVFLSNGSAFKPIFLTSNEEIWKITESALLSDLDQSKAMRIMGLLEMAQQEQAPKERRSNLLQACIRKVFAHCEFSYMLSLALPLVDEALVKVLGVKFFTMDSTYNYQPFLEALLMPEFAPIREKFWAIFALPLNSRIKRLKAAIMKPFDENHPDLEAIFPKDSAQAKWLMLSSSTWYGTNYHLSVEDNDPKKAEQVVEQLKAYNLLFSAQKETLPNCEVVISLKKTENFERYLETLNLNKELLPMMMDLEAPMKVDDSDLDPPMKEDDGNLEPPMKEDNGDLEPPVKDDDGDSEPPMKDVDGDLEPPMIIDLEPPIKEDDGDLEPPMKKQKIQ